MGNKRNRWSIAALICSILPIVTAAILIFLCLSLSSEYGEAKVMTKVVMIIFDGFFTAPLMMGMGIISVVLGIIAIRKPEPRGKTLATVAIFLGILEIGTVIGFLLLFLTKLTPH
ncbi:MAG: hypothetical protein WBC22_13990 [Sedimentisphaerales bacterium]